MEKILYKKYIKGVRSTRVGTLLEWGLDVNNEDNSFSVGIVENYEGEVILAFPTNIKII